MRFCALFRSWSHGLFIRPSCLLACLPGTISVPFTYASAAVLSLMDFSNPIIYITTSWTACRMLYNSVFGATNQQATAARRLFRTIIESRTSASTRKPRANSISDSMRGLAVPYGASSSTNDKERRLTYWEDITGSHRWRAKGVFGSGLMPEIVTPRKLPGLMHVPLHFCST